MISPSARRFSCYPSRLSMARSRRRYDIYNQPGLFDEKGEAQPGADNRWEAGRVLFSGGESSTDRGNIADPLPQMSGTGTTPLRFISFGSGSSGNCAFIGTDRYGFLIDAGVDGGKVEGTLRSHGYNMFQVNGIVLTHDHHDHVSHAYSILRRHPHMALYCTPRALTGLLRRHSISRRIREYHRPIYKETPFNIKDFIVTAFEVSHDGTDNVGYFIEMADKKFVVATDMGFIGERASFYMNQATALMIESDYDADMLRRGTYPEYLKARIVAEKGHLSNLQVAEFLGKAWSPHMRHIFLCHLSKDNNTPEIATLSASQALTAAGATAVGDASESLETRDAPVQLYALPRFDPSPLFVIR